MNILAIEPYYGGSHKAFLDGWIAKSAHDWTLLGLPAYKWKWRMRHGAMTLARMSNELLENGQNFDIIFCSDMLNLAEYVGMLHKNLADLPKIAYFHENQITYPYQYESDRDYQFGMTNITTAFCADQIWFNSRFAMDEFYSGATKFLKRMPDYQELEQLKNTKLKSKVVYPGITPINPFESKHNDLLHIVWAARWEHDKNPEDFFKALKKLKLKGHSFKLSVLGEQFRSSPDVFDWAREYFADNIVKWGFQASRQDYETAIAEADVFVSTANHEFFGITAIEAASASLIPLLPNRLAYPEVFQIDKGENKKFFYDGSAKGLFDKLISLIEKKSKGNLRPSSVVREIALAFGWDIHASCIDQQLLSILR